MRERGRNHERERGRREDSTGVRRRRRRRAEKVAKMLECAFSRRGGGGAETEKGRDKKWPETKGQEGRQRRVGCELGRWGRDRNREKQVVEGDKGLAAR